MKLFDAVPNDLFSVLASPNRILYADALTVLYDAYRDSILDGLSKKEKAIAAYLRANPQVTNKALIATESGISRSTVVKYYDEIRRTMAAK